MSFPIGIFGPAADPLVRAVGEAVERRGGIPIGLDPADFPAAIPLSDRDGRRTVGGVPDADIRAWYIRFFHIPDLPDPLADLARKAFLTSWLLNLDNGRRLVNPVGPMQQNFVKPHQLERLRAAGLPVPRTLVTNSPRLAREFLAEIGDAVYKPVGGGEFAQAFKSDDAAYLHALRAVPLIIQERLTGIPLRVHVLNRAVIDCVRIDSPHLDYREGDFAVTHMTLDAAAGEVCVRAAQALGMAFAALDVFLQPDGSLVLLEANPTPDFLAYDGAPIADRLAAYLLGED